MTTSSRQLWRRFERHCQELFGLADSPGSGNQWHTPGDGNTTGHHSELAWPLQIDAKYTSQLGFRVNRPRLDQYVTQALERGRHFALPVRFEEPGGPISDYVLVPLDDYAELVDHYVASFSGGEPRG